MRKSSFGLAMIIAALLTMVVPAVAADLHEPHQGTDLDCKGDEIAVWHFVANQTDGVMGKLIITLPNGDTVGPLSPTKYNKNLTNQHWWVEGENTPDAIDTAETVYKVGEVYKTLPGKLVISDAYCEKKD